jgi:hypothetical protein
MKPIDIVIDVAKALQDWDGSPEQAGEKLLLACKAVQAYSPAGLDPSGASKYWHGKMLEALAEINRLNTLFAHGDEMALREALQVIFNLSQERMDHGDAYDIARAAHSEAGVAAPEEDKP